MTLAYPIEQCVLALLKTSSFKSWAVGDQVPIIEGHPSDARLAMTAGYDGNIVVWDVVAGRKLTW